MKAWKNPEILEMEIKHTSQGGSNALHEDKDWTDQDGALWTSYASAGDLGGDSIHIKPTGDGTIHTQR